MKLHDLKPAAGSKQRRKRVGRGAGTGKGKYSGRGIKGQKSRNTIPPGFEGGQIPLQRRQPKWGGFTPRNRVEYAVVNVARLDAAFSAGETVGTEELRRHGIVRRNMPVKILGQGDLSKALTVRANAFSAAAREKIEAAGGSVEVI